MNNQSHINPININADRMQRFMSFYQNLNSSNVSRLEISSLYHQEIEFNDPFHLINGLDDMTKYFLDLYENVQEINFEFSTYWASGDHFFSRWLMTYTHPKINGGQPVTVEGGSELIWQGDKIIFHKDLFDAGNMLYEHLPILGWVIRKLKARMAV